MIRRGLYILVVFVVMQTTLAQNQVVIKQAAQKIYLDAQNSIYLLVNSELFKYNAQGELKYRYSDAMKGEITSIDVTNPLQPLVFFKQSNVLVYLNQQMAPVGDAIDIYSSTGFVAELVSASVNKGYWLYDASYQNLVFIGHDNAEKFRSGNLSFYLDNEAPTFLMEQDQTVVLGIKNSKVLVFDEFANYLTTQHLKVVSGFVTEKNTFRYFDGEKIVLFNFDLKKEQQLSLSTPIPIDVAINRNQLLLRYPEKVVFKRNYFTND